MTIKTTTRFSRSLIRAARAHERGKKNDDGNRSLMALHPFWQDPCVLAFFLSFIYLRVCVRAFAQSSNDTQTQLPVPVFFPNWFHHIPDKLLCVFYLFTHSCSMQPERNLVVNATFRDVMLCSHRSCEQWIADEFISLLPEMRLDWLSPVDRTKKTELDCYLRITRGDTLIKVFSNLKGRSALCMTTGVHQDQMDSTSKGKETGAREVRWTFDQILIKSSKISILFLPGVSK